MISAITTELEFEAATPATGITVRKAAMRDIPPILALINDYASQGVMLPRTEFELSENRGRRNPESRCFAIRKNPRYRDKYHKVSPDGSKKLLLRRGVCFHLRSGLFFPRWLLTSGAWGPSPQGLEGLLEVS
jgi:hypothetical protein